MVDEERERLIKEIDQAERDFALASAPPQMRYFAAVLLNKRRAIVDYDAAQKEKAQLADSAALRALEPPA